jgi:transposase
MGHVEGESRKQRSLIAPSLDEVLAADHAVRVIDAFVDTLDLAGLKFGKVMAQAMGRPPYRPGDLLKLYVYGYMNQLRSSRRLEREAVRNLEVLWLLNRVSPSFKTIADFRRDHAAAIVGVCRAFVQFCRGQSLYGGELLAIDGTKIEAVASRKRVITPKSLATTAASLDRRIADYLAAMDTADRGEAAETGPVDVAAALAALREKRASVQRQAATLAAEGLTQQVVGEAEAKLMRTARHGHQVAYNAQAAVDGAHGLIAAFDLTSDGNDHGQLLPMALAGKAALEAEALTVVADTGYSNGEQAAACDKAGVTAIVPRPQTVNPEGSAYYSRDAFVYDATGDTWTCPAGATLSRSGKSRTGRKARYTTKACGGCALKPHCTEAANRMIIRDVFEDQRQAMHQRALDDPTWMKRRRELAEHPFAIMKWAMGNPRFLLRGRIKAKAELALAVLGFNLRRAITVCGVPALLAALEPVPG